MVLARGTCIPENCYGRCFRQDEFYFELYAYLARSLMIMRALVYLGRSLENINPDADHEQRNRSCSIIENAQTCINACPTPTQLEDQQPQNVSQTAIDLLKRFCAEDIIQNYDCLVNVWTTKSNLCKQQCGELDAMTFYSIIMLEDFDSLSQAEQTNLFVNMTKNLCRFFNCRMNCLKENIITKCGPKGYQAAKNGLGIVGDVFQMVFENRNPMFLLGMNRFNIEDMPIECTADRLVRET